MSANVKNMGFATKTIHGGYQKNEMGALTTPIYQTSTFMFGRNSIKILFVPPYVSLIVTTR